MLVFLIRCACALAAIRTAHGVERVWTGESGSWAQASLWSPAGAPAAGDDVVLSGGGNATLFVNASANVRTLELESGTLSVGATLTVAEAFAFRGGDVAGDGVLSLADGCGGTAPVSAVERVLTGTLHVARGATLAIAGTVFVGAAGNASVAGDASISGGGAVDPSRAGTFFDRTEGAALNAEVDFGAALPWSVAAADVDSPGSVPAHVVDGRYALKAGPDANAVDVFVRAGWPAAGSKYARYYDTARTGLEACAAACLADAKCASFDYDAGGARCERSRLDAKSAGGLSPSTGVAHYERRSAAAALGALTITGAATLADGGVGVGLAVAAGASLSATNATLSGTAAFDGSLAVAGTVACLGAGPFTFGGGGTLVGAGTLEANGAALTLPAAVRAPALGIVLRGGSAAATALAVANVTVLDGAALASGTNLTVHAAYIFIGAGASLEADRILLNASRAVWNPVPQEFFKMLRSAVESNSFPTILDRSSSLPEFSTTEGRPLKCVPEHSS